MPVKDAVSGNESLPQGPAGDAADVRGRCCPSSRGREVFSEAAAFDGT